MSDLKKQLRTLAAYNGKPETLYAISDTAADRIEELEAENRRIRNDTLEEAAKVAVWEAGLAGVKVATLLRAMKEDE